MRKMSGISKIVTTMKKIMKPFVLVAAAAMALASCQKNEIPAPEKQDVHFTINAGIETKTSIVESEDKDENGKPIYHAQWDGNEELGVLFAAPKAETTASDVVRLTNAVSGRTASFQGNVTLDETSTSTFYAFYPAAAFYRGYGEGDARLDLKNVQNPTATSFDPLCDILVAKPYEYEVVEGKVVADGLEFARLMSVLRIDLKSEFADIQNEFVESVSFTAGDVEITGYARVFLDNPKFDKWASNGAQWCTVTANYDSDLVSINGTSNSVYLVIAPVTIPANKDLTFEIKTKNYNISKTIKSPEMKFTAGKVSKINLTIVADNCDKIDTSIDYSGEYLIVNTDLTKAASKWADGNNLPAVDLNTIDGIVYESDNLADCKMNITKVTEGENAGKYTIKDAAGKYLYAASSSKNQLKGKDEESYWTIIEGDGKYIMTSHSQETRNILRYNGENTPPIFSCYSSGQSDVTLYKYSDIKPDTTPKLELGEEPIELTAAGGKGTIAVTAKNLPADIQVRALTAEGAQDEVEWLTAAYADGVIAYTAEANESTEARTAYIEAYVSDDLKAGVSVTQEAAGVTKQYYVKVTTAPTDWSGTYLMVCDSKKMVLSSISTTSTKYGEGTSVTITDNKIEATETLASYQVVLSPGSTSGSYLMKFKGSYLYWNSGNSLAINASDNSNTNWLLSVSNGNVTIKNCKDNTRVIGWNAGSPRFACYTSSQTAIQLYKLEDGNAGGETPEPEEPTPAPRNLAFSSTTATAIVGQAFIAPTLSGVKIDDVTYSSSDTGVATVDETGVVTLVGAGTTTITATAPATNEYEAGTASYTLTVSAAQGGGTKTISFKLDKTVTGSTSTSYVQNETAFTYDGIQYAVNNWNPSTLQIRGNQTSQTNMQSGKNFYLRNQTAIPGKITSIKVEYTSGSLVATSIYAVTSTSQITNQTTSASKKGTAATKAVIWDFDANGGYFAIGMQKGGTSGTAISGIITITYEAD